VRALALARAERFECDEAARAILYAACKTDLGKHRLDAFAVACRQNNLLATTRILLGAGKGEGTHYAAPNSLRPLGGQWTLDDASKLSAGWLWALTCAIDCVDKQMAKTASARGLDRSTNEYWTSVVGEFMAHLAKCELVIWRWRC
jgi:hypothetical protein